MAPRVKVVNHVTAIFKQQRKMEAKYGAHAFHATTASYHVFPEGQHAETADSIVTAIDNITPGHVFVIDGSSATSDSFLYDLGRANLVTPSLVIVKYLEKFLPERSALRNRMRQQVTTFNTQVSRMSARSHKASIVGFVGKSTELNTIASGSGFLVRQP